MQSLPLMKRNTLARKIPASLQLRGMAARKLASAYKRKIVTAEQAAQAMREGEVAVAELLATKLYSPTINPAIPAIADVQTLHIPSEALEVIEPFVRELAAESLITEADWANVTAGSAQESLAMLANLGAERIVHQVANSLPEVGSVKYTPFKVTPQASLCWSDANQYFGESPASLKYGVSVITMADSPFVSIPTPSSKDEASAVNCIIRAISQKSGNWIAVPPDDVMEVIGLMEGEVLKDIKIALGDQELTIENIPPNARESLLEIYGDDPDDEGRFEDFISSINCSLKGVVLSDKWTMGDGKLEEWLANGKGNNHKLVKRLYEFWRGMPKYTQSVERDFIGDGNSCDLYFTWEVTWESNQDLIQSLGWDFCPVEVFRVSKGRRTSRAAENLRPNVAAFRAAVIATSVATAIAQIIIDETSH